MKTALDARSERAEQMRAAGSVLLLTRLASDAGALLTASAFGLILRFHFDLLEVNDSTLLTARAHIWAAGIWVVAVLAAMGSNRLFDEDTLFEGGGEVTRVVRSVVAASAVMAAFVFFTQSFFVSRSWFGMTAFLSAAFLVTERSIVRRWLEAARASGRLRRPVILVSRTGEEWPEWNADRVDEFEVVARLTSESFTAFADDTSRHPRGGAAVVMRARDFDHDEFWRIVLVAGRLEWSVFVHSPVRSVGRDRLAVRTVGGHTIVRLAPPALRGWRAVQKRLLDLSGAGVLLVLISPLMLAIAISIVATSGFPVLFGQERVGLGGRRFRMYKFRTMRADAELASGPVWAQPHDPRRTPVGAFLRRSSLDELPQLWNVLIGDMSLVGPRPERPVFVGRFSEELSWYAYRHRIRPGITGLAQARGFRGDSPLGPRVELDNWYIENWSVPLDLKILGATVLEVVRGRNAY